MKQSLIVLSSVACLCLSASAVPLAITDSPGGGNIVLCDGRMVAPIFVETSADRAVLRAANDLAVDFSRVTGLKPELESQFSPGRRLPIIIGTLDQSRILDQLCARGKLETNGISGQWESYVMQVVMNPLPGVDRALVIAGSDRRGTIYGIYQLSAMIGVSPWCWWADTPVAQKQTLALSGDILKQGPPAVKYRGIFINDEDWGLNPWAAKTFDPEFKNIGPKTYGKIFELLLRLRLNYLWPAMHGCSTAFGSVPENAALADEFAIVMGSSHCEPMLYNNVHWNERTQGRWNYALNRSAIHGIWEETAKARGQYEAVWTLGIRGIHDQGMEKPPDDIPGRINLMGGVFSEQRELLDQYVGKQWGPVAQCFVPYKEVLPIYDAGLKVPDDVTLVWVDDNFGYIRRLSNPDERKRSGGAGVYYHLSYYGGPHSYTWINTTAPALMWEELHKAWENGASRLWVLNVGDLKPAELGIDYFSKLAWNPDAFSFGGQRAFLQDFIATNLGLKPVQPPTDLLMEYYRLGTLRKPELMERNWALALTPERAAQLEREYQDLLAREKSLSARVPTDARDAYMEMIGFPARVLGDAGLIFMADRKLQEASGAATNGDEIAQLRNDLQAQVENYNTKIAGGRWNHIMPGLVTGGNLMAWSSQVRWPWGEKTTADSRSHPVSTADLPTGQGWRDAATAEHQTCSKSARWTVIEGLGPSGRAMALEPASLDSSWAESDTNAPSLEYDFTNRTSGAEAFVDFLPAFRIYPGMKLRVAVSVDKQPVTLVEVPGSSGAENENGAIRSAAVQDNFSRARIPLSGLAAGRHALVIRAVDPGAVVDRVSVP